MSFVYSPIVKSKQGERWALRNLREDTRAKTRPVVELHDPDGKALAIHLAKTLEQLHDSWGTGRFYLDGIWLHDDCGIAGTLDAIFTVARACGLRAIPVVRLNFTAASLAAIRQIIELDSRGCLVRVSPHEAADPDRLQELVDALGIGRNKIDLMIDYGGRPMRLALHVPSVAFLNDWRNFIAAAGVFPNSVADLPLRSWQDIPRRDWQTWREGVESELDRDPIFADYTTRAPGPASAGGGNPPVHLRYSRNNAWAVRVDGRLQAGDAPEMHTICGSLLAQPFFRGETFSAGDMELVRVATPDEGSGGPTQWVQWGVSHHIELVVDQLESLVV